MSTEFDLVLLRFSSFVRRNAAPLFANVRALSGEIIGEALNFPSPRLVNVEDVLIFVSAQG